MGVKQLTGNVVAGAPGIRHQGSRSYLNGFVGRNGKARIVPAVGDDLSVFHDWKRLANFEDSVAGALQCGEGLAVGIERQAIEIENLLHGTFDQAVCEAATSWCPMQSRACTDCTLEGCLPNMPGVLRH